MSIEEDKNLINPEEDLEEDIDFELMITPTPFTEKINPYLLQSFYKTTQIIKKEGLSGFSTSLFSPVNEPNFFNFFNFFNNNKISNNDFFNYVCINFKNLTSSEIQLIDNNFDSKDYTELVFNYIISSSLEINKNTFDSFIIINKFDNKFKNIFQQHLMTKYAINNMNSLQEIDLDFLFSKINVNLSKNLFFEQSVKNKKPISNQNFWTFFNHDDPFVKKYLEHAANNKWSKHLNFFFNNYHDMAEHYFINLSYSSLNESDKFFEQHFILHNPFLAHLSHLEVEELHYVFSKIYSKSFEQKFNDLLDLSFDNLRIGKYFLLDYIGKNNPSELRKIFEFNSYHTMLLMEDLAANSSVKFKSKFHESFNKNVLIPNLDIIFNNKESVRNIFKHNSPFVSFLAEHLDLLPEKEQNHLIFLDIKSSLNYNTFNSQKLHENLSLYTLNSLKKFEIHFDLSLEIINNDYNTYNYSQEVKEIFSKIILNKKLESDLANSNNNFKKLNTKI